MSGPSEKTEAIVLRTVAYGESDLIVSLLTAVHGRISAFARSARKSKRRFPGGLDLFSHMWAHLTPPRRSHDHLWGFSGAELIDTHVALRSDLKRLAAASYLTECLSLLSGEGDPQPALFSWWKRALAELADPSAPPPGDCRRDLELLKLCGYAPRWNQCTVCGKSPGEDRMFFSFERGGVSCPCCRQSGDGLWLETPLVRRLAEGRGIEAGQEKGLRQALDGFVTYTAGREPKSQRFRNEVFCGTGG